MKKVALILGITGQDGSYLADQLVEANYEVHGMVRRSSVDNLARLSPETRSQLKLHHGDMTDPVRLQDLIDYVQPDEIYNEADQDHIGYSHLCPSVNYDVTFKAVGHLLEIIRLNPGLVKRCKLFQPISATVFGEPRTNGYYLQQDETSDTNPLSPYACAKLGAWHLCKMYRQRYGLFVSCGILYNHDSIRRQGNYLLHEIARQVIEIIEWKRQKIELYDPYGIVDIGHAPEFMVAARKILGLDKPDDFVIGTGQPTMIRDIINLCLQEVGIDPSRVEVCTTGPKDPNPEGKVSLVARYDKTKRTLNWAPNLNARHVARLILYKYQNSQ